MREFSNHTVMSMSDSTMAVSSKYIQDLSVQIVFFTFSFKWFLCFYLWAEIWAMLLTCSLVCMSLRQLARALTTAHNIGARSVKTLWRHLKADYPLSYWLIIGWWTLLNLRWLGLGGQTMKNLRRLACKFDIDQGERKSSQVNASARKSWPNRVGN